MDNIAKYIKHAHSAGVYLAPFICLLALAVVLNVTNPLDTGAVSILVVFILLYFLIFSTLAALFHLFWIHMANGETSETHRDAQWILCVKYGVACSCTIRCPQHTWTARDTRDSINNLACFLGLFLCLTASKIGIALRYS